jgi:hypothetical protein
MQRCRVDRNKEIGIGERAKRVYEDLETRFALIRDNLHKEWEGSAASDIEGRERVWNMLKGLNELERSYLRDIETGMLAKKQLEKEDG